MGGFFATWSEASADDFVIKFATLSEASAVVFVIADDVAIELCILDTLYLFVEFVEQVEGQEVESILGVDITGDFGFDNAEDTVATTLFLRISPDKLLFKLSRGGVVRTAFF